MKRGMMFLFLVCAFAGLVSSSVEVHNYSFDNVYSPFDSISGDINLTIVGENFGQYVTSNDGGSMKLGDFLVDNGVVYYCTPADCSDGYEVLESGQNMTFSVPDFDVVHGGFVLTGEDVDVTGIGFDIESDFVEGANQPISIDFFEGSEWDFEKFSTEYSGDRWGCYNPAVPVIGPTIRKASYCEMIFLPDTGTLYVGADVDNSDVVDLKMTVYPELGGNDLGNCEFNPGVERGCVIDAEPGEIFSGGDYQVCVSKPDSLDGTNYRLFQEEVGSICGFVYSVGPGTGSEDYAVFAKAAKYAGSERFSSSDLDFGSLLVAADSLVDKKYNRNCSDGCVLPFVISGVSQNVVISNVIIDYFDEGRDEYIEESSTLNVLPSTVDFSGVLDLGILGFNVSRGMSYKILLGDNELLKEDVEVLPAPIVSSVSPLNPPAGVPIEFRALVQFDGNDSLSYKWTFGDGKFVNTDKPFAVHTYDSLGNYTMSVEVSAGGLSTTRNFAIDAISPEVAIDVTLSKKRENLNSVISVIGGLPSWYGRALSTALDVDRFDGALKKLDKDRNDTSSTEGFVKVAEELYALDVPVGLIYDTFSSPGLMTELNDIDVGVVASVGGAGTGGDEDYKNPILVWQDTYIIASVSAREFFVLRMSGEKENILNVYTIDVTSSDFEESYFVIDKANDELSFKEEVGARDVDGSTVVVLDKEDAKSFAFYYEDDDSVSFFVSPRLSSIVIEGDIGEDCNFNFICEDGESYKTCRSDCKPVWRAILYGVLGLVGVLILWGLLQVWYKRRYEGYLFKDRRNLYNLVMYVTNARARQINDLRTRSELRAKGWSSERVDYVIKKSRGQRVGMFEILPLGKIAAWWRNWRARRSVTVAQQQIGRNINKSGFQ
jgi:PKD repeat protein